MIGKWGRKKALRRCYPASSHHESLEWSFAGNLLGPVQNTLSIISSEGEETWDCKPIHSGNFLRAAPRSVDFLVLLTFLTAEVTPVTF